MVWETFRIRALEASAYARQAFLVARDLEPSLPERIEPGDQVVFFLHGFMATAGVLRPLRDAVTRHAGLCAASLTYPPGPGVENLAERLAVAIDRLPADAKVHLVGHSLGGIVARYYVVTRRDRRVLSTTALASPFGGVRGAAVLSATRDLDPKSAALALARSTPAPEGVSHLSIFAGGDPLTRDHGAHTPAGASYEVAGGLGHNALLYDADVIALVERRILGLCSDPVG